MKDLANADFWRDKWRGSNEVMPRWDLGRAHPLLNSLISDARAQGGLKDGARIYVPGCGRAHDAWALSRMGYRVHAVDIIDAAISHAKEIYPPDVNFQVEVGDAFLAGTTFTGMFDAVYDRAMLCALDGPRRKPFVASMEQLLKSGGLFMSIGFNRIKEGHQGPPFAINLFELESLFSPQFTLVLAEQHSDGAIDGVIVEEIVNIWRKN